MAQITALTKIILPGVPAERVVEVGEVFDSPPIQARSLIEMGSARNATKEEIDAITAKEKASEAEAAELAKVAEENAKERARLEKAQKEAEAEAIKATGFYSENDPQAIPKGKGANA